jgi:hypothetical protein
MDTEYVRITKIKPKPEVNVSIALLETLAPSEAPARRPTNIKNHDTRKKER